MLFRSPPFSHDLHARRCRNDASASAIEYANFVLVLELLDAAAKSRLAYAQLIGGAANPRSFATAKCAEAGLDHFHSVHDI